MNGCERRQKPAGCYQMKSGNVGGQSCCCPTEKPDPGRESEDGMDTPKRFARSSEHVRTSRYESRGAVDQASKMMKRPCNKACPTAPRPTCKQNLPQRREAIKRLSKIDPGSECPGGRPKEKSELKEMVSSKLSSCQQDFSEPGKSGKELPKKPELSINQLSQLIEQEAKDVDNIWALSLESKESYKKPCPKQQKARDAVKAIVEPKKAEEPLPCFPQILLKEPLPFVDPDPDDITPEVAANMIFVHERGIKMVSSPEVTVKHLFADQLGAEEMKEEAKEKPEKEAADETGSAGSAVEESDVDDSVFTRNMAQRESGEEEVGSTMNLDTGTEKYEKKGEFVLQEKAAKCVNKVQLRGNCAPWFPGYFVAFPDQTGAIGVQIAKSPSGIFQKAWMAAKPSNIPSSEIFLVE